MLKRPNFGFHGEPKFHHGPPDIYGGPQEYVEAGARGFLVKTLPGKEEFAVDDAIQMLRQASMRLFGAVKVSLKKESLNSRYLTIDFMDPNNIKLWPTPEEEMEEVDEIEETKEQMKSEVDNVQESTDTSSQDVKPGELAETNNPEKEPGEENETKQTSVSEEAKELEEGPGLKTDESMGDDPDANKPEAIEESHNKDEENKNSGVPDSGVPDDGTKSGQTADSKPATVEKKKKFPIMRSIYKFKAYRTERRNVMFIKSDVPDPLVLAEAVMDMVAERQKAYEDGACQLLPIVGVCRFDNIQLELMSLRVLSPLFCSADEPLSFSIMVVESTPGANVDYVVEIVRNVIWSLSPDSWQSSPLTEPDILILIDVVGSKLLMSCVKKFIHYRYYSPNMLVKKGFGEPEDDDGSWLTRDERRQQEQFKLARERQKEQEKKRQEQFRKEKERRKIQQEERKKKSKEEAANKQKKEVADPPEKEEPPGKNEDNVEAEISEDAKDDDPPNKKPKLDAPEENQSGSEQTKSEVTEDKNLEEDDQDDEDPNAEVDESEEAEPSAKRFRGKRKFKKRGRVARKPKAKK